MFFTDWLIFKGFSPNFEAFSNEELSEKLSNFYPEARQKDGKAYSKSSLLGIRASINRQLKNAKRDVNIMSHSDYRKSNHMLLAVLKKQKQDGLDQTKHYSRIIEKDMRILKAENSFDLNNPVELQEKVFFDLQLHFARRGRENICHLRKDFLKLCKDENGIEYFENNYNELTKNHQNTTDDTTQPRGRMYATQEKNCPVNSLKHY